MRTALLVIDLQKDFLAPLPEATAHGVVTAPDRLVDAARAAALVAAALAAVGLLGGLMVGA